MVKLTCLLDPLDEQFSQTQIPYAAIGAYAAAVWGEVSATRDVHLVCDARDLCLPAEALEETQSRFECGTNDFDEPPRKL